MLREEEMEEEKREVYIKPFLAYFEGERERMLEICEIFYTHTSSSPLAKITFSLLAHSPTLFSLSQSIAHITEKNLSYTQLKFSNKQL
jgi:hypothetical protein